MKPKPNIALNKLCYFPFGRHWRNLKSLYQSKECETIWRLNLRDFSQQAYMDCGREYKYEPSQYKVPCDHGGHDWLYGFGTRGRKPAFWEYICFSGCHFMVDAHLYVAMKAFPHIPWRIVTSSAKAENHSTIWNGSKTNPVLFDPQSIALKITAQQAWKMASKGRMLKPGRPLRWWVFQTFNLERPENYYNRCDAPHRISYTVT